MENEITFWLKSDGSFSAGVDILRRCGGKVHVHEKVMRQSYITPTQKEALRQAIQVYAPPAESAPMPVAPPATSAEKYPPEVLRIRQRRRMMMKEQAAVHARMCAADTDEERYIQADDLIRRVIPEIDRLSNILRAYEKTGEVPMSDEKMKIVTSTVKKVRRELTLKVRLSQLRKKIASGKLSRTDHRRYVREMEEKNAEREALRRELGM